MELFLNLEELTELNADLVTEGSHKVFNEQENKCSHHVCGSEIYILAIQVSLYVTKGEDTYHVTTDNRSRIY